MVVGHCTEHYGWVVPIMARWQDLAGKGQSGGHYMDWSQIGMDSLLPH